MEVNGAGQRCRPLCLNYWVLRVFVFRARRMAVLLDNAHRREVALACYFLFLLLGVMDRLFSLLTREHNDDDASEREWNLSLFW